jgi:hypothetical protein
VAAAARGRLLDPQSHSGAPAVPVPAGVGY